MRRAISLALAFVLALLCAGCGTQPRKESGRLRVVTTLFPYYDFARAVAGEHADVKLLLSPGREAHSFEPTPLDAVAVAEADVFLYNGGESEQWVEDLLDAAGENIPVVRRMMDFVSVREEEFVEGMQGAEEEHDGHDHGEEEDSDEIEYDEHVWTSPENAAVLCEAVCEALCEADAANASSYRASCEDYLRALNKLDGQFRALRDSASRDLLVFADRMPLLYFCTAYDLRYRAAFHGCSTDTEPSLSTLKYLIDKVREERIPVIYTVDLDSRKIAEAVSECTGAEIMTLYSMQTVSTADFESGETYLTLMQRNYTALERGLT